MSLAAGTKLGPYEIVAPLGQGGMGEVYRARDTRLDRSVAIKVVRASLSSDGELRQRLEREAKAISALNHPNICTLYDVGCQDGVDYLVMEYLEGETLADRLRKKPLALDQILKIGMEVAEGLDRAHRAGIIHRDLKPGNIMLTPTGAKLMDFGLARTARAGPLMAHPRATQAAEPAHPDAPTAALTSPVRSTPLTTLGEVVGTVQYMSPEQVEGKELTGASDIFAFGAVLYEMVTGRHAFDGSSPISVASAILEKQPEPISALQRGAPPALEAVIQTCLAKDPEDRYASAHDVKLQLKSAARAAAPAAPDTSTGPGRLREGVLLGIVVLAVLAAGWLGYDRWGRPQAQRPVVESTLELPQHSLSGVFGYASLINISRLALSPDGQFLAFTVGAATGDRQLWLRPLRSGRAYPLPGTEGAVGAFWSPDARYLGFFTAGQLKKVALAGGVVSTLCATLPYGGTWAPDGTIVFAGGPGAPLSRVASSGGDVRPIPGTTNGVRPVFLPDGRHFLYSDWNKSGAESDVKVGSIEGGEPVDLGIHTASRSVYASGYLIYASGTQFLAQRFDPARLRLLGAPQVLVEGGQPYFVLSSPFTVSGNGLFAYRVSGGKGTEELQLFSPDGRPQASGIAPGFNNNPRFSPDGKRLAYDLISGAARDIWIFDLSRRVNTRLTLADGTFSDPLWSPDGKRIAFTAYGQSSMRVVCKAVDGGSDETLLEKPSMVWARSWSRDGRYLFVDYFYRAADRTPRRGIQALDLSNRKTIELVADDKFDRRTPIVSPDGRWLAYVTNESGREEVYVQSFPANSSRVQVSSAGGIMPRWRGDGRELYFITGNLQVAAVEFEPKGDAFELGALRELFPVSPLYPGGNPLDVTLDGKLFVVDTVREGDTVPVTLLSNWVDALPK